MLIRGETLDSPPSKSIGKFDWKSRSSRGMSNGTALSNSESCSVVVKTFTDMRWHALTHTTHKIDTVLSLEQLLLFMKEY